MATSAQSLRFQFHPNLSVEVLQVPRFAGLTDSCNCKFSTRNVRPCVHHKLQIRLFVCFANGLAPARHKYVSTERSICLVCTGTSQELALENSPGFRQTSIPHHTATAADYLRNIRHVNCAHLYAKMSQVMPRKSMTQTDMEKKCTIVVMKTSMP